MKLASTAAGIALGLSLALSTASACPDKDKAKAAESEKKPDPNAKVSTAAFRVQGMHCAGCADEVKEALNKSPGIIKVDVKVADHRVTVTYDANKINPEKLAKLLSDAGFPASAEA